MTSQDQTPQFTTAEFRDVPADSPGLFLRGLLFGAGGALVGLILYSAVGIITGLAIGFVSLAVGYIVGKAILLGSRGVGGRRYQIAALLLTYGSVSMSAVPIFIWELAKNPALIEGTTTEPSPAPAPSTATPPVTAATTTTASGPPSATPTGPAAVVGDDAGVSPLAALGTLLFLGLASPFLGIFESPGSAALGLIILGVGLQIAWKMTGIAGAADAAVPIAQTSPLAPANTVGAEDDKSASLDTRG
jgi:hypothetical protein